MVAPLFVLAGMFAPRQGEGFSFSGLALMVLGTAGAYVAIGTGESAAELVEQTPAISAAIEAHAELADWTRLVFSILTALFAAILLVPLFIKKPLGKLPKIVIYAVFLALYAGGMLVLANTADRGGKLVHGYDIHASFFAVPTAPGSATAPRGATAPEGQNH